MCKIPIYAVIPTKITMIQFGFLNLLTHVTIKVNKMKILGRLLQLSIFILIYI